MPFIEDKDTNPFAPVAAFDEPEKEDRTLGETFSAAFRLENPVVSAFSAESDLPIGPGAAFTTPASSDFDPVQAMVDAGRDDLVEKSIYATNEREIDAIIRQSDRELEDRKILQDSGATGFAANLAAGVTDPINFIPVGGVAYKTYRGGGSILKGALVTSGSATISASASEMALHHSQIERTYGESAVNVGAATVFAGLLGGGATALGKLQGKGLARSDEDIIKALDDELRVPGPDEIDLLEPNSIPVEPASAGAAAAPRLSLEDEGLASTLGAAETIRKLPGFVQDPLLQSNLSKEISTRRVSVELAETPLKLGKNETGVATPVSVEREARLAKGAMYVAFNDMDNAFVNMRKGRAKKFADVTRIGIEDRIFKRDAGDTKLNYAQFKEEVGKAMRRGDQHDIPEVAQAAQSFRKNVIQPLADRAQKAGLLGEGDLDPKTAQSYFMRIYNKEKIISKRPEFKRILTDWLEAKEAPGVVKGARVVGGRSRAELDDVSDQIIDRILGTPDGRLPYDGQIPGTGRGANQEGRGPLRERLLLIDDELIEEFLESDVEHVAQVYTRTMAPDVALKEKFGDVEMTDQIKEIQDGWNRKIDAAGTEKERVALQKEKDLDIKNIAAMRDRIRGTFDMPKDPTSIGRRAIAATKQLNFLRLMGGVLTSSIPDLARPIMTQGLRPVLEDGILAIAKNPVAFKMTKKELNLAGAALDIILDSRAMALADVLDDYGRYSKFERGLQSTSQVFGNLTGINKWNETLQTFTGMVAQTNMIRAAQAIRKGRATPDQITRLAQSGIDEDTAKIIAREFDKHGFSEKGVLLPNTSEWNLSSPGTGAALKTFRAAMAREVERTIVRPGQDIPLWMSRQNLALIGQFRSFAFASTQRTTLAALQNPRDISTYVGVGLSVGLGMLSTYIKLSLAQRALPDEFEDWVIEGIDRSGLTGWLFDANNIAEKFTRGQVGVSRLAGKEPMSRYASRNATAALLGPSIGLVEDAAKVAGDAAAGEWTSSDTRAVRRLMPFQNLVWLRRLFDEGEKNINEFFGVPEKRKK